MHKHFHTHPERSGRRHGGPRPGFGPGFGPGPFGPEGAEGFFGPGFGPGPRGRGRRGPGRGRRGDVRNAILALLAEGPLNGYQVIQAIGDKTEGLWRPSAGSVYPALGLLQDEGLIEQVEVDGKTAFALTAEGRNHVEANAEQLKEPWTKVTEGAEGFLDVRAEVKGLAMALHQVVMTGNPEQITAARGLLDEARKGIYRILAGDSPTQG
jgi:DNA-binding PadR family transcriptional regulator